MNLLNFFARKSSAPVARERLQILLAHERVALGPRDLVAILREEILAVIARHVPLDPDKVIAEFQVIATDEAKTFLNSFGGDPWVATPEEAQARLLKDTKDWGEYVRVAKIEPQG